MGINLIFTRSVVVQIYMGQHTRFRYLSPLIYAHADISNKASDRKYCKILSKIDKIKIL